MQLKRIVVTGAAGFIGSHLARHLADLGHDVLGIDDMNPHCDEGLKDLRRKHLGDGVRFAKISITDQVALGRVFEEHRPDSVCHLAALAGVRYSVEHPLAYTETNVNGTASVFETAYRHGVSRVLFASSSSVYGMRPVGEAFHENDPANTPVSVYAATKRAGELIASAYCQLHAMDITCFRLFTVYGPFGRPDMAVLRFARAIDSGLPLELYNNGASYRDYTYVGDIVDGFTSALERPKGYGIINLGRGEPVRTDALVRLIEHALGKRARIQPMPMQPGDVERTLANIAKAKAVIGYAPSVPIEKGIELFAAWYREFYPAIGNS